MQFLKRYKKKYWKGFTLAATCLMIEAICDLMQPTIMSKIVDIGVAQKDIIYVMNMATIMLFITAVGAVAAVSRNILSINVSQRFGAELRGDLFRKIHTLSFDTVNIFEGASLITRLTNDITQVQNFTNGMMRIFFKAPLLCVGGLVMATRLNPHLALILAVVVPIVIAIIFMSMEIGYPYFMKVQKALDRVNSVIREYLAGVRVVKAFNRFQYEESRFEKDNRSLELVSIKAMRVMACFSPGIALTVNLGIVVVLWLGGIGVNNGNMHVGQIIAFINYMTQILYSLTLISFVFTMFIRAKASAERIGEVMDVENTMAISEEGVEFLDTKGQIEFEEISFSYSGTVGEPVLKNITFRAMPGETMGIIGSTGCGKSSLVNLVPRFYDVSSGTVKVNGIDVRDVNPKKLREKIAIVAQKTTLFTGTILENIKWGNENATIKEIEEVAKVAQAHDFITAFKEGYNTLLGQGGINLSGGQKQRIAIARALIQKPEILILDDCTSAVDITTELKIREGLKEYIEKLTCLIIAQRITSVMRSDKILVLDNGKNVGLGNHEELMENCKVYQDLFHSQMGKEEH